MIAQFNTTRLRAERLEAKHLAELVTLHGDSRVMATIGGVRTPAVSGEYLATGLHHWATYGFGLWMFYDLAGEFVGRGGIRHAMVDGADEIELAYTLAQRFWGQGLATEMAQVSVTVARELKIPELVAFTTTTNIASQCVMRKAGFRFEKEFIHQTQPCTLYRLVLERNVGTGALCGTRPVDPVYRAG